MPLALNWKPADGLCPCSGISYSHRVGDTANLILVDIHNSLIIQMWDGSYPGRRQKNHDEPWQRMVARAAVWEHTNPGRDATQDAVEAAGQLAALRVEIPGDPWLDSRFVERFDQRVGGLIKLRLGELQLDPAEAALLALVPLLHQVLWTRAAAGACGGRPEVDANLRRAHGKLLDLLDRRPDADAEIRWWLLHRWLSPRIEVVRQEPVTELLAAAKFPDYLRAEWVQTLLYGLRLEPAVLCTDWVRRQKTHETLFGGAPDQQHVRLPLLGLILSVAHAMAIEATDLSETIVWHVGVPNPVKLDELHTTLATAQWSGTTLDAVCYHAATAEALSEHLVRVNVLLHEVSKAAHRDQGLEPLRALPERVNGDGVVPVKGSDGKPIFTGWNRFNLDEQRVQELLMGEQLYQDRSLAIRELYQNALDACRYRRAREEYLSRTTGRTTDWVGGIRFEQGVDETNRPYLDCVDNGIGMGITELTGVFARAGARFSDLTEFRDEQADWEQLDPPVELFPNSRFGIGVLSYFMLADEITITTCRMDRTTGRPGPTLTVTIVGPGHLFHIQEVSGTGEPGTRVRLHLRSDGDASCVRVLDRLLGIAEFDTTAHHGEETIHWKAGELRIRDGHSRNRELNAQGRTVANSDGTVFWCGRGGAVLVDGLVTRPLSRGILANSRAGETLYGAVVNITGSASPRLSVDRVQILDDISAEVERKLSSAIPDLVESNTVFVNEHWLSDVTYKTPWLADLIFDQWTSCHSFFLDDRALVMHSAQFVNLMRRESVPDSILLWRLLAHNPNKTLEELIQVVPELDRLGPVLDARPSDSVILTGSTNRPTTWIEEERLTSPGHIFWTGKDYGLSPRAIAQRLVALGFAEVEPSRFPDERTHAYDTEIGLLHTDVTPSTWLSPTQPLPVNHATAAAAKLRIDLSEALDFLSRHGFSSPPNPEDLLRSRNLDGKPPWLDPREQLRISHVIKAAAKLETTTSDVHELIRQLNMRIAPFDADWLDDHSATVLLASCDDIDHPDIGDVAAVAHRFGISLNEAGQRLENLGIAVPAIPTPPPPVEMPLLSRNLSHRGPWLRRDRPVPPHHFLRAQWKFGTAPEQVAEQLKELGYETVLCEQKPEDMRLLGGTDLPGSLDLYKPVTLSQLVMASRQLSMPIDRVATRMRELGMDVPDIAGLVRAALTRVPRRPEQSQLVQTRLK